MTDEALEALRRLLYVPDLESVKIARLEPNDVIIVEVTGALEPRQADYMYQVLREVFGQERRILLVDEGMRLRVAREVVSCDRDDDDELTVTEQLAIDADEGEDVEHEV